MRYLAALLLLLQPISSVAIDPLLSLKIGDAESKLLTLERTLSDPETRVEINALKELQQQGLSVKNTANECIEINEASISKNADAMELLGSQSITEEQEVTDKRQSLNQDMLSSAQQLASCRLLLLRSHEMVDVLLAKQQEELANELREVVAQV